MKGIEKRILYHLLLHCNEISSISLSQGRIGILLALATYAKQRQLVPILETSIEILSQYLQHVPLNSPLTMAHGLSGIGWGLEYLSQKEILSINTLDACEAIDHQLMAYNLSQASDYNIEHGAGGLLLYVLSHIQGNKLQQPFSQQFLEHLLSVTEQWPKDIPPKLQVLRQTFHDFMDGHSYHLEMSLTDFIHTNEQEKIDWNNLSLENGLAGRLVKHYCNI